ncbi:MAG: endolytic transglycosylase MltG [Deltaproteobacteria bacterium]|nr:endolytic transglycosylase MltG [Deltaproteobacteria bacterium]
MNDLTRFTLRMIALLAIPVAVGVLTYAGIKQLFRVPVNPSSTEKVLVEVRPEKNFRVFSKELAEKGLIKHWRVLDVLARIRGKDTQIKAGEYELSAAMTPIEILHKLVAGDVFLRRVTVKEGTSIREIGKLLESAGLTSANEFDRAIYATPLLYKAGINAESFEGYLYPETYNFSRTDPVDHIIWRMMEQGEKQWPDEFTARADELNLSRHEILILASVIEKESGNASEAAMISSVFHNRLANGMKLQSDPTVIYGLKDFDGNLTKADLQNPHPYNTYVHYGLPPGPICNPGINAIRAALYPAETNFLFFVSDGTGKHVFSSTLKEHNEAVRRYQIPGAAADTNAQPPAAE